MRWVVLFVPVAVALVWVTWAQQRLLVDPPWYRVVPPVATFAFFMGIGFLHGEYPWDEPVRAIPALGGMAAQAVAGWKLRRYRPAPVTS